MKYLVWMSIILSVWVAGCSGEATPTVERVGQSAAQATESSLATSIARQLQATPQPRSTAVILGESPPTATPVPTLEIPTQTPPPTQDQPVAAVSPSPVLGNTSLPPTATPQPTAIAAAEIAELKGDHFWLVRPFVAADGIVDFGAGVYRFGSTGGGRYSVHHGVDMGNPIGTPVLATAGGIVVFASNDFDQQIYGPQVNFYGNHVVIVHTVNLPDSGKPFTFYTLYGHLSEILVESGQVVNQYDEIGLVGMSGVAVGPHLHLEVRMGDNPFDYASSRNPDLWLQPWSGYGVVTGRVASSTGELLSEVEVQVVSTSDNRTYRSYTYVNDKVQSDPAFSENFVVPDILAGEYEVKVSYYGRVAYRRVITVEPGKSVYINALIE